ncbi:2OG-Fe dioxygenase family protein [Vibrio sp. RE86]|uniref:2OG-Fe dioxygenase family protein n=1 Tax=Vibrio sp. RE86 TaxID=2607605 RepID=UPI0014934191|nr:2OG-Fe dioxygenase family protein [Vibrio sp. RE86]NOH78821.1 2OG-Fe dioxygenase family protein [Vibrio sp. RE86]
MREEYPYVDGCKFIEGQELLSDINLTLDDVVGFREFFDDNIALDPYSNVRIRGMLKLEYDYMSRDLSKAQVQSYFQSADANNLNGGSARTFNTIDSQLLALPIFKALFAKHEPLIRQYCERNDVPKAQLSIHFIRYQANKGEASYSSPVWLHKDDEPIVFIHLVNLTDNALGADNVIAGMDDLPTKVIRLTEFMDCLIVDPSLKHAVTPVGSKSGVARRDVMLVNLEDPSRQGGYA